MEMMEKGNQLLFSRQENKSFSALKSETHLPRETSPCSPVIAK